LADSGFVHIFEPPSSANAPILLLLHGTGGNEQDLLSLAEVLAPDAGILSPRGKVLERGMPRFFRRLAEGVFDIEDLKFRTGELADFLIASAARYGFDAHRLIAVGFSNGANIAASLLLSEPEALAGAVLMRAMVPFVPRTLPVLDGLPVLILSGAADPLIAATDRDRLAKLFSDAGAAVTYQVVPAGHNLAPQDVAAAARWLAERP